jgi:predicted nucleic-acid-binding Zn-ribbon protein
VCGNLLRTAVTGPTQRLRPDEDAPAEETIRQGICPKCGSDQVIPGRSVVVSNGQNVHVVQFENPYNLFPGSSVVSTFRAWICGECGYTEFYAKNHRELYEMYRRAKENQRKKE